MASHRKSSHPRPAAAADPKDNAEFYAAAARGELRFQRCAAPAFSATTCAPRARTRLSLDFTWERSSGRGCDLHVDHRARPTLPAFQDELLYTSSTC